MEVDRPSAQTKCYTNRSCIKKHSSLVWASCSLNIFLPVRLYFSLLPCTYLCFSLLSLSPQVQISLFPTALDVCVFSSVPLHVSSPIYRHIVRFPCRLTLALAHQTCCLSEP